MINTGGFGSGSGNYNNNYVTGNAFGTGSPKWHVISRSNTSNNNNHHHDNHSKKVTKRRRKSSASASASEICAAAAAATASIDACTEPTRTASSIAAVSPTIGKKLTHDGRRGRGGMCGILDSPEHRKITLSWREDPVPSLTDVSMMSVDASCGNDDDSSESKTDVVSTTNAMDLKFRVSELEDEYQSLLDAKSDAEKSLAEERQRHQDVLDRKEALGRMHFNATVLRAKLEMSKLLGNGLCCQSLNVSVAQLYDEAKAQGVDPEAYSTWVRARLLDKK